nr:DUF501 domain-containing protein [Mobiluncus curtisii]
MRIIAAQLGRVPRGVIGVAARCGGDAATPAGHPAVIASAPRLPGGEPFPTFYYLTCPAAVAAASHLEANGVMREAEALLETNPQIAAAYTRAHELYIRQRTQAGEAAGIGEVAEIAGVSAGGMPNRVKCFHALLGHSLAAGRGVNPIGDWVLDRLEQLPASNPHRWTPATCAWKFDETVGEENR